MPGGDRTGPMGMGPMTGRGAGRCAGNTTPGYETTAPGRRLGRGRGMGFRRGLGFLGYRHAPYAPPTQEQEEAELKEEAEHLSGVLETIKNRIATLRAKRKDD
ncbi:MAG: DUF5320 domain-containing protein [Verrucomicrobia bacterium]|jgi:hypothetical protein|nr:DUF5320 domain-containing protein [Verrucomicrobiota bacterium]